MPTFLGIDIGTTTLKICLVDEKKNIIREADSTPNATIHQENPSLKRHEQDPKKIIQSMMELLATFDLSKVDSIGISGQMHGLVLWNADSLFSSDKSRVDMDRWECSNLITWMDHRCDAAFLKSLPEWKGETIATGFGSVSLAWLKKHNQLDPKWNRSGTIMDFATTLLTNHTGEGTISTQNAHGWGFRCGEDWAIRDNEMFPFHLFPKIVPAGHVVGKSKNSSQFHVPEGVKVLATMGDVQTSLMPILRTDEAVLQLGTASQIAFLVEDKTFRSDLMSQYPALTKVPYFNGKSVIIAVGMNGGNCLDVFVKQVAQWASTMFGLPLESLKLKSGLLQQIFNEHVDEKPGSRLEVKPVFYAERHSPGKYGTEVKNWTTDTTAEQFLKAISRGIVSTLAEMMPETVIQANGLQDVRLVNRASQPIFEEAAKEYYPSMKIHVGTSQSASAAYGAALHAFEVFTG